MAVCTVIRETPKNLASSWPDGSCDPGSSSPVRIAARIDAANGMTAHAPQEPEPEEPELDPLWLKLPAELADFFDLGFAHAEPECPVVVFRARDTDSQSSVEISGPPIA